MICDICHEPKQNGEVNNEQFHCVNCLTDAHVLKLTKKFEAKTSSKVVELLKQYLPGDVAAKYYVNPEYPVSRIVKTVWLFRYLKSQGKVKNDRAFFTSFIRDAQKFPIPEDFWDWYKVEVSKPQKHEILYTLF